MILKNLDKKETSSVPNWKELHPQIMNNIKNLYYYFERRSAKFFLLSFLSIGSAALVTFCIFLFLKLQSIEAIVLNFGYFTYRQESLYLIIFRAIKNLRAEFLTLAFIGIVSMVVTILHGALYRYYTYKLVQVGKQKSKDS